MYRAPSGALVFSAGSIQWTWGLDAEHDIAVRARAGGRPDAAGAGEPVRRHGRRSRPPSCPGLVAATKSTDTTGPTVTHQLAGRGREPGQRRAADRDRYGDRQPGVAGWPAVEVSMDNGDTWHPATGTSSWTYTRIQHGVGAAEHPGARGRRQRQHRRHRDPRVQRRPARAASSAPRCPQTPAANDAGAVELGLRFTPAADGFVTGVRFYKGTGNSGTHVGRLWSSTGTLLATVTFAGESATGWQTATSSPPVAVTAGTTYVVSYTAPAGPLRGRRERAFAYAASKAAPLTVAGGFGARRGRGLRQPGPLPDPELRQHELLRRPGVHDHGHLAADRGRTSRRAGATSVPRATKVRATFSKP